MRLPTFLETISYPELGYIVFNARVFRIFAEYYLSFQFKFLFL